jgi:hypothetical protein
MSLSFDQQLLLAVIDKLALGAALVGVGYFANKYLESHKTRQAFASEVARQRLAAITEIWASLEDYELEAYRALGRGYGLVLAELGKAGAALPDPVPRDAQRLLKAIVKAQKEVELSDDAVKRVETWIEEHAGETHAKADQVKTLIARKRFLVGTKLSSTFDQYLKGIHSTYRELTQAREDLTSYEEAFAKLAASKTDIQDMSKSIYTG